MSDTINNVLSKVQKLYKRKFIRLAIPFITIVVGGSFYLKQFTQVKFTYYRTEQLTPEEAKKHGLFMKPREEVTLESQFEEVKKLDIENWENKRIPRPWEDTQKQ